jgi:hypothetical protein
MKINSKAVSRFLCVMAASLMTVSASYASTVPASIVAFDSTVTDDVFVVKARGWRDPAFGDMGWTHSSDWGTFKATKGQTVTITMKATDVGIHPGSTVWYRGANDTAPDNYVVDHFYPQNANFAKFGAVDEDTGAKIGNIIMKHVAHAYDQDGNTNKIEAGKMGSIRDGVKGQLILSFEAPYTGDYQFVVGGFNPNKGVDETLKYNVNVNVTIE